MIKSNDYQDFIRSDDWSSIRADLLEERGLECEKCHKTCKKSELRVHHKHYEHELGFERDEDLMLICNECHAECHQDLEFFDDKNKKSNPNDVLLNGDWE